MTNIIGHGHVIPRDDGYQAKCGGPAVCGVCQGEERRARPRLATQLDHFVADVEAAGADQKLYTQAELDAAVAQALAKDRLEFKIALLALQPLWRGKRKRQVVEDLARFLSHQSEKACPPSS